MDRKMAYVVSALVGVLLTVVFHYMATSVRGYEAIGGEHLFLLLPLWVWMVEIAFFRSDGL